MAKTNDIEVLAIVLLAILCSPIDAQEYHDAQDDLNPPLGIIPIRRAWSQWRNEVWHLALGNQKVRVIQANIMAKSWQTEYLDSSFANKIYSNRLEHPKKTGDSMPESSHHSSIRFLGADNW